VIIHLDGKLVPHAEARVSPFDRGFLMGDGVYEGMRAFDGVVVALNAHQRRLRASLHHARIHWDPTLLHALTAELLHANELQDAFIYLQITRGTPLPGRPVRTRTPAGLGHPTRFAYAVPYPGLDAFDKPPTASATTVEDTRWLRGRVKSTSLMSNVLQSIEAAEAGSTEAIFVRDGLVAEGPATNVLLALPDPDGTSRLVTPSLDSVPILEGVTRAQLLAADPDIAQRPVHAHELRDATEIMLVGTTAMVTAVTTLDGRPVGDGSPGPHARRLLRALVATIRAEQRPATAVA